MPIMQDKYGRTFRTLRVSLLNHCNLGCVYCVAPGSDSAPGTRIAMPSAVAPNSGIAASSSVVPHSSHGLPVPELLAMIGRLHEQLHLQTIRLTGGEPLLYPRLATLIDGIQTLGITEIKLTTNGFLLERQAETLQKAGLRSINVSLDAIDEDVFYQMSKRHGVDRIIRGIDAALATGMEVKINTVVMRGLNETQVLPLLEFAFSRGCRIRFLEVMAMGHLHDQADKYLFTQEELLAVIGTRYRYVPLGRTASATSSYWQTISGQVFGIIANESAPFCGDCDRLRLDSEGNIYGCLSNDHPIPLQMQDSNAVWEEKLQAALLQKQALRFTGSSLSMLHIGG